MNTREMIRDIRHCMEMYPEEEVNAIVRIVESHKGLVKFFLDLVEKRISWLEEEIEATGDFKWETECREELAQWTFRREQIEKLGVK